MQKSQRGLMRSAKQQKRKQKLFALCNNNNPINCRRSPGLPLLEPLTLQLAYCRWFCLRRLASNLASQKAGLGLDVPSFPGSGAHGERAPIKKKKKIQVAHYWSLGARNGCVGWNLGRVRFAFKTGREFRAGRINNSKKLRLCTGEGRQPSLFRAYKIILMIKIHHLASPLSKRWRASQTYYWSSDRQLNGGSIHQRTQKSAFSLLLY